VKLITLLTQELDGVSGKFSCSSNAWVDGTVARGEARELMRAARQFEAPAEEIDGGQSLAGLDDVQGTVFTISLHVQHALSTLSIDVEDDRRIPQPTV
jgi:hypothetical protein